MMSAITDNLKINPDLRRLVLPLSSEEKQFVENELCESGAIRPIRIWENMILVDYEYYDYDGEWSSFRTNEREFSWWASEHPNQKDDWTLFTAEVAVGSPTPTVQVFNYYSTPAAAIEVSKQYRTFSQVNPYYPFFPLLFLLS